MLRPLLLAGCVMFPLSAMSQEHHDNHNHDSHATDHASHDLGTSTVENEQLALALKSGGEPISVDVLGVVCDFCAKAMNKTFGKRPEVAAVYVDLDTKTLNLVLKEGQSLDDATIEELVKKAGYRIAAIHRGEKAFSR